MGSLKVWNGTAWETASAQGPAGPPVMPAGGAINQALTKKSAADYDTQWSTQPFIQAVALPVTFDATGFATVTFPVAFASAPVVVAGSAHGGLSVVIGADHAAGMVTATTCRMSARNPATGAAFAGGVWISYIAYGVRT